MKVNFTNSAVCKSRGPNDNVDMAPPLFLPIPGIKTTTNNTTLAIYNSL